MRLSLCMNCQIADVATGVSTVAASLSSAVVSLAGPFLRQASKQVKNNVKQHRLFRTLFLFLTNRLISVKHFPQPHHSMRFTVPNACGVLDPKNYSSIQPSRGKRPFAAAMLL